MDVEAKLLVPMGLEIGLLLLVPVPGVANRLRFGCYSPIGDHGTALVISQLPGCEIIPTALSPFLGCLPMLWFGAAYGCLRENRQLHWCLRVPRRGMVYLITHLAH